MSTETVEIVDIDTLVRAVLNAGQVGISEDEMIRIAHGTLYWLEVSGVALRCDDQPWSIMGRSHRGLDRLIRERGLTEPVETASGR